MNRCDRTVLAALAATLATAGCGLSEYELAGGVGYVPELAVAARCLAAGNDEAPDELVEFFERVGDELKPREQPAFPPPVERRRMKPPRRVAGGADLPDEKPRFGVRGGQLAVQSATYDWPDTPFVGVFYRMPMSSMALEIGGEFAQLDAPGGAGSTQLLFLRGDVLFRAGGPVRLVAGGAGVLEVPDFGGSTDVVAGAFAHAGVGVALGTFDLRLTYNANLGADANTTGYLDITAGVVF
jgi:hypothetical protein